VPIYGPDTVSDPGSLSLDARSQSVSENALDPGTFPFEAWEFDDPQTESSPDLILLDPWRLYVEGALRVGGFAIISGVLNVTSGFKCTQKQLFDRNTVHAGAANTDGSPAILSEVTFGGVTILGAATDLIMSWADGFGDDYGNAKEHTQLITTDASPDNWKTLINHGKEYLYKDLTDYTYAKTRVPPQYGTTFDPKKHALLHMAGIQDATTFTDEYGNTWTAVGDADIDLVQTDPWGTNLGVLMLGGSTDYIETTDIRSLATPFTMEGYFRTTTAATDQTVFGSKTQLFRLYYRGSTTIIFIYMQEHQKLDTK